MSAFAAPFPIEVIASMIGVEPAKHRDFRAWSNARAPMIDPLMSASERVRAEAAGIEPDAYFSKVIEQRRIDPRDDIVSALVAAEGVGDRLSAQEVLNMLRLLLIAGNETETVRSRCDDEGEVDGKSTICRAAPVLAQRHHPLHHTLNERFHETTANLLGNTVIALHAHPGALEALRSAGVSRGSFEELLRYDSPVQADLRGVVRDMDFGPVRMRAGDGMVLLLGSANRDPAVFPIPDRLNFERSNSKAHVSFGRGIHHCLGAQLVGLEVTVALEALLGRWRRIELRPASVRYRRGLVRETGYNARSPVSSGAESAVWAMSGR